MCSLRAFSGPILWAASTHIDKYLVDRYFKNSDTAVLMVFTALIGLVMLPFIAVFRGGVTSIPPAAIAVMIVQGILYMGAMLFYLRAIQQEEASVVAPFFQVSTIFTFILAWVFLHERIGWLRIGGGVLVVAGAMLLSVGGTFRFHGIKLRLAALMVGASLVMSASSVLFKYFAVHDAYWVTTFWTFVGEALFGLAILAVPKYWRQFLALFRKSPGAVIAINGANELIDLGGGLGVRATPIFRCRWRWSPQYPRQRRCSSSQFTRLLLTVFFPRLGREDLSRNNLIRKARRRCW